MTQAVSAESWKWNGDLRLRTQLDKNGDSQSRLSERIRARFGVNIVIDPKLRAEIRLASAKSNRSTNQSLADSKEPGFRRRFIGLDLAYVEWAPVKFAKLYVGRMPQIQYRPGGSQLVLDDDLSLEGAGLAGSYSWNENFKFFLNSGSHFIRENYDTYYSEDQSDNMINWAQIGLDSKLDSWKLVVGGGFYNFVGVQDRNFSDLVGGGVPSGNTEAAPGVVKNVYLLKEFLLEVKKVVGEGEYALAGHYVINDETADPNQAWIGTASYTAKVWDAQLSYANVESDAVVGLFTNSDFANGETDSRGWIGNLRWKFAKNMSLRFTHFDNRLDMTGLTKVYWRSHMDISAQF